MDSSRVSSGRALTVLTGLDLRDRARPMPVGLNPVHRVLVLLWIFCSALEAGGVLGGGEVQGRWYPYSQDCLSILGGSTQRLFSTTINFDRSVFRICSFFGEYMIQAAKKESPSRAEVYVCTSIDRQSQQPWFSGKWHAGSSSLPARCQNILLAFHFQKQARRSTRD